MDWKVKYEELVGDFRTGDVVLMHGDFKMSKMIQFLEGSKWTHSGMLILAKDIGKQGVWPDVLFWESNSLTNLPCLITGKPKTGPMLVPFKERLQTNMDNYFDSVFAVRPNTTPVSEDALKKLVDFMPTVMSATFPSDLKMWYENIEGRKEGKFSGMAQIFCSELLTMTFQAMGLMSSVWEPNAARPKDYSSAGEITFLKRGFLAPEIYLDIPKQVQK
ncbi:MAG: hypothetical protein EP311_00185 [Cytophagales bacterium]|nr:MAG: hypothetical protein EP311_00185 [Cytophagales bacterium]